jgi:hypothetical protein
MADSTISKFIDGVLKERDSSGPIACLFDVSPTILRNHQYSDDTVQRILYVTADIYPDVVDVKIDVTPTEEIQQSIRYRGYPCDEPGLIIPAEFGGSAQWKNIFSKSRHVSPVLSCFYQCTTFIDGHHRLRQRQKGSPRTPVGGWTGPLCAIDVRLRIL